MKTKINYQDLHKKYRSVYKTSEINKNVYRSNLYMPPEKNNVNTSELPRNLYTPDWLTNETGYQKKFIE